MGNKLELNDFLGKIYKTNTSGECFIVDVKDSYNVTVMFYDGFTVNVNKGNLDKGKVKNPFHPNNLVKGVGLFDSTSVGKDKGIKKVIEAWNNMLQRCYCNTFHQRQPTYKDVIVCDRWKTYSNFEYDLVNMLNYEKFVDEGWVLDKDILSSGNKVYSPETCCFIPKSLNSKISSIESIFQCDVGYSILPSGKYRVCTEHGKSTKHVGCYDTPEEASNVYKTVKCNTIISEIKKWEGLVDDRVLRAIENKVNLCVKTL